MWEFDGRVEKKDGSGGGDGRLAMGLGLQLRDSKYAVDEAAEGREAVFRYSMRRALLVLRNTAWVCEPQGDEEVIVEGVQGSLILLV